MVRTPYSGDYTWGSDGMVILKELLGFIQGVLTIAHMGGCQNQGPFLAPCPNMAPSIQGPRRGP